MKAGTVLMLVFWVAAAHGRIGETALQCDQRYGKPEEVRREDGAEVRVYWVDDVEVWVTIPAKGRADSIMYRRLDTAQMPRAEMLAILRANCPGEWTPVRPGEKKGWVEGAGDFCFYHAGRNVGAVALGNLLMILTEPYLLRREMPERVRGL
jgi:hypothetical protein